MQLLTTPNLIPTIPSDLRGFAYAIVKEGTIMTTGSFPAPEHANESETMSLNALIQQAKMYEGDLYIGDYPSAKTEERHDVIFGLSWGEIQRRQQKLSPINSENNKRMPENAMLVFSAAHDNILELLMAPEPTNTLAMVLKRADTMDQEGRFPYVKQRCYQASCDFQDRIITLREFEERLDSIENAIKYPLSHGQWVVHERGVRKWQWEGRLFGCITDTRITENRLNAIDVWRTSDNKTHDTMFHAKRHELESEVTNLLVNQGFLPKAF